jgi:hypothetical protein
MGNVMAHWRVEVSVNGESILSIEPEMLAGKSDLTEQDEAAILTAAQNLLGFLGHNFAPPTKEGE